MEGCRVRGAETGSAWCLVYTVRAADAEVRVGRPGLAGSHRNPVATGRLPHPPQPPHSPAMKRHMLPTASQASPTLPLAGSTETGAKRSTCEELLGPPWVSLK